METVAVSPPRGSLRATSRRVFGSPTELIGQGAYGAVYITRGGYVVKRSKNEETYIPSPSTMIEIACMRKIVSPYVLPLLDIFISKEETDLVFPRGTADLGRFIYDIHEKGESGSYDWRSLYRDFARGLLDSHNANIIHLDIKPGNVIINENGRAMVADYGLAWDYACSTIISGEYYTTPYRPPEGWYEQPLTFKSDVWAFGASFYQAFIGVYPFAKLLQRPSAVAPGLQSFTTVDSTTGSSQLQEHLIELGAPVQAIDLIQKCMTVDVSSRLSMMEVLQHPYLSGGIPRLITLRCIDAQLQSEQIPQIPPRFVGQENLYLRNRIKINSLIIDKLGRSPKVASLACTLFDMIMEVLQLPPPIITRYVFVAIYIASIVSPPLYFEIEDMVNMSNNAFTVAQFTSAFAESVNGIEWVLTPSTIYTLFQTMVTEAGEDSTKFFDYIVMVLHISSYSMNKKPSEIATELNRLRNGQPAEAIAKAIITQLDVNTTLRDIVYELPAAKRVLYRAAGIPLPEPEAPLPSSRINTRSITRVPASQSSSSSTTVPRGVVLPSEGIRPTNPYIPSYMRSTEASQSRRF